LVELTFVIVGEMVSNIMFLLEPREPAVPGVGSVRIALFPPASSIVPPFNDNALVEI
jgi:hypothetical protein